MNRNSILPLLLAVASGADARPIASAPGDGFEVERYTVPIRPDLATMAVSAMETIVLRTTSDDVARLSFTANELRISKATVDGATVQVSSDKDEVVFDLPFALRKASKATLRFRIYGTPARGITAAAGGIYTSYFACDWMVCLQDAPGDKAHLTLNLFLPAGMESVGVGRAGSRTASSDGLVLHRWRSTRPYSPYLYAFAAGPFARQSAKTAQGELVYVNETGTKVDLATLFARTPAMVAFLADKAGMPLRTADTCKCWWPDVRRRSRPASR